MLFTLVFYNAMQYNISMTSAAYKRVAIYIRVSTLDQDTHLQSRELMEYVQARGWDVHQVFEEKITGTHANRKMLKELQADARQRKFDILLVWKLDRIFRSLKDCINCLQEFAELGIEFVSLKDTGIDMTTPSGKLLLHILAAFAEFEGSIIRMRVKAGLEAAKAKGKRLGRPKVRNDDKIRLLRAQGRSIRAIAKELGTSVGAVQRALKV